MSSYCNRKRANLTEEDLKLIENNKSQWFSSNCLWGYDSSRWNWFILLGSRERGKSYDIMKKFLRKFWKTDKRNYFTWIRLYESEQKAMLANNANQLIDPDLRRKYITNKGYDLHTNKDNVYIIKRDKKGKIKERTLLCRVLCLATAGSSKGQALFDKDWLKNNPGCEYLICLDEFNRVAGQKKTFDIVSNLKIQLENLIRSTSGGVRIFCIANNVGSCSDLLASWNMIPHEFGIFRLASKGVVIYNIPNSDEYVARRSKSALNRAFPIEEDSNYTNEQVIDRSLIVPAKRKLVSAQYIIMFRKPKDHWFCVWDNGIIKQYNNETCTHFIPMRMYLDQAFIPEQQQAIIDRFTTRGFKYKNLITFIKFQNEIEQLKPQR